MKDKLITLICARFSVTADQLTGKAKAGIISDARQAFVYVAYNNITRNKTQIAAWLNRKSHMSATELLESAEANYRFDRVFRRHVDTITNDINT